MTNRVKVIDSIMGSGKTSYVISLMNNSPNVDKFIYITPYLKEVERVQEYTKGKAFKTPDENHGSGRKYTSFKRLIAEGENIITTHALFSMADDELLELLQWE